MHFDDDETPPPSSDPIPRKLVDEAQRATDRMRYTATEAVDKGAYASAKFEERTPPASEARYHRRIEAWMGVFGQKGRWAHRAHWLLHNNLVHPLLAAATLADQVIDALAEEPLVYPSLSAYAEDLHHVSSHWLNQPEQNPVPKAPHIPPIPDEKLGAWVVHNLVVHPLIGLCPCRETFQMHDDSAARVGVKGWV